MDKFYKFFQHGKQTADYLGCYSITDKYFAYTQGFLYNEDMSIDSCMEFCYKFDYMWLKKGVECTCSVNLDELRRTEDKLCNLKCNDYQSSCGSSKDRVFSVYTKDKEFRNFYRSDEIPSSLKQIKLLETFKMAMLSTTTKQIFTDKELQKIYLICLLSLIILIIFILIVTGIYFKQKIKFYLKNFAFICLKKINFPSRSANSDEENSRSSSILSVNSTKSSNKLNSKQNLSNNFSNFLN